MIDFSSEIMESRMQQNDTTKSGGIKTRIIKNDGEIKTLPDKY